MSSCRDAPFVPWCLLFEDMFDYDLTLVKCERSATPGSFRLYFHVENYEDTFPRINKRSFFKNFNESRLLRYDRK